MFSINSKNDVPPLASAGSSNEISESNDFSGEVASTSDRSTLPETTSASDRLETSLLYGSALESLEPIEETLTTRTNNETSGDLTQKERMDFVKTFKDNYEALAARTNEKPLLHLKYNEEAGVSKAFIDSGEALTVHTTPHLTENGFLRFSHDAAPVFADAILESFTHRRESSDQLFLEQLLKH